MKKFTAILSAALMLLSLGACKKEEIQEHNTVVTVSETAEQTAAPVTEILSQNETSGKPSEETLYAHTVHAKSFSVEVPASWEGRYTFSEIPPTEIAEEGMLRFGSVKNAESGGNLFSVFASSKAVDEQTEGINLVSVGFLTKDGEKKYVYAVYPTDCQYDIDDPENFDEYSRMQRDGYDMLDGIKGTDGWEYTPVVYDRLYE